MNASGLPHSEIPGSKPVCGSPELFAAYHVLHRHLSPRHSPYALSSLTIDMRTHTGLQTAFASVRRCESFSAHCVECVVGKNYRLQDIQLSKNPNTLVENTGLEPVTSWLQTRRSPS
jgi:hypothetical protein